MNGRDTIRQRLRLEVTGTVQGVGFRPFVARTAMGFNLTGWVANRAADVLIEIEGRPDALARFREALDQNPPAAARIARILACPVPPRGGSGFAIAPSLADDKAAPVLLPDRAPCPACLAELDNPASRRYRYPFISCAECGPRASITSALPFDRERTSLADFPLCADCAREYANSADRRFDAQTISCPTCGPQLALLGADGSAFARGEAALTGALAHLACGEILALKGVGGFQLLVDARGEAAIAKLRARKARPAKPLAVMVGDLAALHALCTPDADEIALLESPAAPIVLIASRPGALPDAIAPGCSRLGVMLPASGLHALIAADFGAPLVVTSGNRAGEPIALDEEAALAELAGIADLFLVHNRRIENRLDDSVTQIAAAQPQILRRARGYVPQGLALATESGDLALGAQQKSCIALGLGRLALSGPHIGELEHAGVRSAFAAAPENLCRLYRCPPRRILIDAHPDYASSVFGFALAQREKLPLAAIWHHVAHVHAVIAEHDLALPVLGLAWDGMGLGENQSLRGSEAFRVTKEECRRCASLAPFPLPGGEAAQREPRRAALGLLFAAGASAAFRNPPVDRLFAEAELTVLTTMLERGINSPGCHSMGRLFDAVSALLGLSVISRYEGDAAMALQSAAEAAEREGLIGPPLAFEVEGGAIVWKPLLEALLAAQRQGFPVKALALAFHEALARLSVAIAEREALSDVALSGGCFQNRLLLRLCVAALREAGFRPHWGQTVPCNDGGIAIGQLGAARFAHFAWCRDFSDGEH
ncbi:carbamoyltransferase HypF [Niveibacterium terrae]|uniref:carbamoyltransferase HypF n=1 Tax=Niveibacterium terrae TaxID=3373598 RepID=UPI003A911D60